MAQSDSTGAEQDGAAQTVDKARFDGLMSAYQREMARANDLERRLGEQVGQGGSDGAGAQTGGGGATDDSQQTAFEEGEHYVFENGAFAPYDPGTPFRHSGASRGLGRTRADSEADLRADLDRQVGKPSRWRPDWDLGV